MNLVSEWLNVLSSIYMKQVEAWHLNNKFNNSNVTIFIMICIKQQQAQFTKWNTEPHHSSVKISEHGEHRLHTLYMQEESLKPKISIYTYWKLAEAGNSNSYRTPHCKRRSMVWIAEPQSDCTTSFFQKIKIISRYNLASRSLIIKLKTWSLHQSVWASIHEDQVLSFELWVSTYFWLVLYTLISKLWIILKIHPCIAKVVITTLTYWYMYSIAQDHDITEYFLKSMIISITWFKNHFFFYYKN